MKKNQAEANLTTDQRKLKGEATREKLVIEAIRLFGKNGYKATNTRALADAAECNLGLITFHFGGKLGLYHAAIERVKRRAMEIIYPSVQNLEILIQSKLEGKELFKALTQEINNLATKFSGIEQVTGHALLLMQDINDKKLSSMSTFRDVFAPLINNIEIIINKATNHINPTRARLSAFLIINAPLGFLRDYPIFFPETKKNSFQQTNTEDTAVTSKNTKLIEEPSFALLIQLLSHHLVSEFETYFNFSKEK